MFSHRFSCRIVCGVVSGKSGIQYEPWFPRKDNVKVQKLVKIVHFVKFFKIFSLKLFLIIQGNIIPGFLLQIRL